MVCRTRPSYGPLSADGLTGGSFFVTSRHSTNRSEGGERPSISPKPCTKKKKKNGKITKLGINHPGLISYKPTLTPDLPHGRRKASSKDSTHFQWKYGLPVRLRTEQTTGRTIRRQTKSRNMHRRSRTDERCASPRTIRMEIEKPNADSLHTNRLGPTGALNANLTHHSTSRFASWRRLNY